MVSMEQWMMLGKRAMCTSARLPSKAKTNRFNSVVGVYLGILSVCFLLTIAEIVQLARHKLKPLFFLITNVIKSAIWTALFLLDIIAAVRRTESRKYGAGVWIVSVLLL
jgi:hypothetical protein